jgi:hypothetical protein
MVLLAMVGLAVAIALGQVKEQTSYGLVPVVTIIGKFVLDFSEWAFRGGRMHEELPRSTPPAAATAEAKPAVMEETPEPAKP